MDRKLWFVSLLLGVAATAAYLAADYVYQDPESAAGQLVISAYEIGIRLTPLPVLRLIASEKVGEVIEGGVPQSVAAHSSAACPSEGAAGPEVAAEMEQLPEVAPVETLGSILVVPDADTAAGSTAGVEESEEIPEAIPPRPADETRPPAIMPLIEDEPAAKGDRCFLSEYWQQFKSEINSSVKNTWLGTWLLSVSANSDAGVSQCGGQCDEKCPAQRTNLGTEEQSEATQEHIKSLLPKSRNEDTPDHPHVDTMEYRASDARKGEFDPKPW